MKAASPPSAGPRGTRALLIAAADDALVARALAKCREQAPGVHVTAIARAGASLEADETILAPTRGPYGFALTPALLTTIRRRFEFAWAVVGSLDDPAYRRAAALLRLARARQKRAIGRDGEIIEFAEWLARAGIAVGAGAALRAALAPLTAPYRKARVRRLLNGPRPPWGFRRVNIGVSDRCNHRCIMCSEHSPYCADGGRRMAASDVLDERDFGLMDFDTYRALIADLSHMGCREVELCGLGEPLLHPRLLDLLREAKQAGLWLRLVTNASLLDEEKAREIVALGLDELHISLNAAAPDTYAKVHGVAPSVFDHVLAAIRSLVAAREEARSVAPVIETSLVVQALNYREPMQWVQAVAQAGAGIITFSALGLGPAAAPVGLTPQQYHEAKTNVAAAADWARSKGLQVRGTFGPLAEAGPAYSSDLYAHMPCYIGYIFALVTATGRIHPCCACARVVGDLREGGFARTWRAETYRRFREECLDLPNRLPALANCSCMSCPYGPWNVEFHQRLHRG